MRTASAGSHGDWTTFDQRTRLRHRQGASLLQARKLLLDLRCPKHQEWQYNRISSAFAPFCGLEGPRDDGAYELVCKAGWPKLVVSNRPDGSFATKDLFIKHPTRPGLLKMVGRVDDTLVLVSLPSSQCDRGFANAKKYRSTARKSTPSRAS